MRPATADFVGATGDTGPAGATGPQGDPGIGVPAGGAEGQVLTKDSNDDYDTVWATPASGGGAGGEAPIIRTGAWSSPLFDPQLSGSFTLANDCTVFVPFPLTAARSFDRIGVTVPWFGPQPDVVVRLGIWLDDDGYPGDLVVDAGTIDASSAGTIDAKQCVIAETLPAGLLWLSASHQGTGSGTVALVGGNITGSQLPAPSAGYLSFARAAWKVDPGPSGALPSTAPPFTDIYGAVPAIALRAA